jgi:hypothetical protein
LVVKDGKNSIVIENKIYAEDQNQQLIRYYNKYPNAIMLYLTLDGKEAASKSVTSAIKQEIKKNRVLIPDVDYFRISYKENNVSWLDACIPLVMEYPFLRESINQYLNIVKQLTGQSINKDMDNEIKELIINSSETYNAALSISRNINASRSALLGNYRALIQKELEDFLNHKEIKYKLEFTSDKSSKTKTQILFEEDSKYKLLNNNIIFEISRMLIPRSKTSKKFDVNSNFYFGLRYDHKENDKKESDIEELKGCLKSNFETNKWWLARVNHNLNFRDNYIKLADDDYMKKDVTDVIRNMKTMITKYIGLIND